MPGRNEAMAVKPKNPEHGEAEVEAYLARGPEPGRAILESICATIRAAAPKEATEALSYGIPSFQYHGALASYAACKEPCSLFPMDYSAMPRLGARRPS